jgi:photosystem II stability/assembly factor-like uncharacterized protein
MDLCTASAGLGLRPSRRALIATLASAAAMPWRPAIADAPPEALDRAAVPVRDPQRAVLLAIDRAGPRLVAVGERGIIVLSDDDGQHWRQADVPTSVTLTGVRFADAKHGWAIGHGGVVLRSDDAGQRWTRQLDGRRIAQLMQEAARTTGDAIALREADRLVKDGPDKPLLDIQLLGGRSIVVVGAYGLALASKDGGNSWQSWADRLPNPRRLHIYAARRLGDRLMLVGEQGLVMLSVDAGRSFRSLETPYKGSFFSAEFLGDQGFVLAGLRGTMLRSTDDARSWESVAVPSTSAITATAVGADGRLLAVNQAGLVMTLRGDRMVRLNNAALPPLSSLLPLDGSVLALSTQGATLLALQQ